MRSRIPARATAPNYRSGAARQARHGLGRHLPRQAAELRTPHGALGSACSTCIPDGLYWNESTQLLYWTYYDAYNVTHNPDWGLGATRLDDPASRERRPRMARGGRSRRTPTATPTTARGAACYLFSESAGRLDDVRLDAHAAATRRARGARMPMAGVRGPLAATPSGPGSPDLNLPLRYLEHYFMGNQGRGRPITSTATAPSMDACAPFRRRTELPVWEDPSFVQSSARQPCTQFRGQFLVRTRKICPGASGSS